MTREEIVRGVVQIAEARGLTTAHLVLQAGVDPDRLNNGGLAELVSLLLDEGDDPEWIEELLIAWRKTK
jgi:hypothetical protein